MDSRGVNGHHGGHLQDDVLGLVDVLQVADVREDHVLDVRCVRKVYRGADAADEDVRDEGATTLLLHAPVDRGAGDAPEDGDLRPRRLVDDDDQRERDRHGDAREHAQEERAEEGHDPENEVRFLDPRELDGLVVGHESNDRVEHHRGQSELGQIVEEWREKHQRAKHHDRRDEAGQLRERARGVVHRRPGEAAGHGVAGQGRADEVGEAQGQHLLPGVDLVAVLRGQVFADCNRLHVANEARGHGGRQNPRDVAQFPAREAKWHQAAGDIANVLHVEVLAQTGRSAQEKYAEAAADKRAQRSQQRQFLVPPRDLLVRHEARQPQKAKEKRHALGFTKPAGYVPDCDVDKL
mmetsp:Transcript_33809/g.101891  ORF Transcript_33809/g.101891 Transcript_33809/m.101891 type:complete len:351 (+) Transcript_33809:942-1994(+)